MSKEVLREEGWNNGENYDKVNEILGQVDEELLNHNVSTGSNINDRYEIISFFMFCFCVVNQLTISLFLFLFLLTAVQEICQIQTKVAVGMVVIVVVQGGVNQATVVQVQMVGMQERDERGTTAGMNQGEGVHESRNRRNVI